MANESVFGQSSLRDLDSWIDKSRLKSLSSRGLSSKYGTNFSNTNTDEYINTRNKIMDIIQKNRSISIDLLFKYTDNDIISNPNIKKIILDICKDGDVSITSKTDVSSQKEIDFVFSFVKRKPIREKNTNQSNYSKTQSNIENVLDNTFYATGRKLEFEKKDRKIEELNISLKKPMEKTKSDNRVLNREFKDIRNLGIQQNNISTPIKPVNNIARVPETILKKVDTSKIKEIDIFATPKKIEPIIKPFIVPEPIKTSDIKIQKKEKMKKYIRIETDIFEKYNEYDILYMIKTMNSIKPINNEHKMRIQNTAKLAKIYAKSKSGSLSTGKKVLIFLFSITIILSTFIPVIIKSSLVKDVKRDFRERVLSSGLENTIEESRQKYHDVFIKHNI